jgi:alpha-N-arabinofuranosidase
LPARFSPRRVKVACTEWNAVRGRSAMRPDQTSVAAFGPTYQLHDALAVATFANVMQRHCRDITLATVAQSINVVGLIGVNEQGMWLEPSYWAWQMVTIHSGPLALDAWVASETFDAPKRRLYGMTYLDASVTLDPDTRTLFLSLVNRHASDPLEVDVRLVDAAVTDGGTVHVLFHGDPNAMNSHAHPDAVRPHAGPAGVAGSRFTYALPPHSYTVLTLPLGG